uniref:Uncharacterized protein n=1 Tax=Anguilla anguilla TaxID=7936 RepID=A0A0E9XLI6_ANGAN
MTKIIPILSYSVTFLVSLCFHAVCVGSMTK